DRAARAAGLPSIADSNGARSSIGVGITSLVEAPGLCRRPLFSSSGCVSFASVSIRSDTAVAGAAQCHRRLCCRLWLAQTLSRAHYLRQTKAIGARRRNTALIKVGADLLQFANTPRR